MSNKWTINGVEIARNPISFTPNFAKRVNYVSNVSGKTIRIIPEVNNISMSYNAEWYLVDDEFRNFIHDLYIQDKDFVLKTHLTDNPREAWRVKIDSFEADYVVTRDNKQRFNLRCLIKVLESMNDPIIIGRFNQSVYPFVVYNPTNIDVFDFAIFVSSHDKDIDGISITSTNLNLLKNPGFEKVTSRDMLSDWEGDYWESDIVLFYEGERCARTYKIDSPISQSFVCPSEEELTVMWSVMGDEDGSDKVKVTITFYDIDDVILDSYEDVRSVASNEWSHFSFQVTSPADTVTATVDIEKISGEDNVSDYVYVDRVGITLGSEAVYRNTPHRTLVFPDVIPKGEVLKINLLTQEAYLNNKDVTSKISGEFFDIPIGKSLIVFEELDFKSGDVDAVVRYNEVFK